MELRLDLHAPFALPPGCLRVSIYLTNKGAVATVLRHNLLLVLVLVGVGEGVGVGVGLGGGVRRLD